MKVRRVDISGVRRILDADRFRLLRDVLGELRRYAAVKRYRLLRPGSAAVAPVLILGSFRALFPFSGRVDPLEDQSGTTGHHQGDQQTHRDCVAGREGVDRQRDDRNDADASQHLDDRTGFEPSAAVGHGLNPG